MLSQFICTGNKQNGIIVGYLLSRGYRASVS